MGTRFKMGKVYPASYKALDSLDQLIASSSVEEWYQELIKIRASQINGCAYCVNMHTQAALKLGIDARKINLINVWREADTIFTEEEQLVIRMTEELTLIHQHGLSDSVYEKALALFGEEKTAQIIMVIITINAWTRIGVGLKMQPQL
jgi:AhpD family alkylhydroperoxidase